VTNLLSWALEAYLLNYLLTWYGGISAQSTLYSMGTQLPLPKKATNPTQFLAYVYCGQTAGWMKTPIGTEVDLVPGHIVLDGARLTGPQLPSRKDRAAPPLLGPCLLWPRSPISATAELLFCSTIKASATLLR